MTVDVALSGCLLELLFLTSLLPFLHPLQAPKLIVQRKEINTIHQGKRVCLYRASSTTIHHNMNAHLLSMHRHRCSRSTKPSCAVLHPHLSFESHPLLTAALSPLLIALTHSHPTASLSHTIWVDDNLTIKAWPNFECNKSCSLQI